jgi:hypothetical protein
MAQLSKDAPNVHSFGIENGGITILHVGVGKVDGIAFSQLALDVADVTYGTPTTWVFWPMTTGALRFVENSSKPTGATQDSAGTAVNH